jgi:hypothetical protein
MVEETTETNEVQSSEEEEGLLRKFAEIFKNKITGAKKQVKEVA